MRAADLKPDTEYSTCNGAMVVPVEPIHGNWFKVYDVERDEWDLVDGGDQPRAKADPWGGCHPRTKASQPRRRRTKPGVLVDRYEFDRDGKRLPVAADRRIVEAADIVGTWKEYLALYADVVRRKVDQAAEEAERDAAVKALTEYLAGYHGVDPSAVSLRLPYSDKHHVDATVSLRLKVPRSRAKNPPHEYVRAARALGLMEGAK